MWPPKAPGCCCHWGPPRPWFGLTWSGWWSLDLQQGLMSPEGEEVVWYGSRAPLQKETDFSTLISCWVRMRSVHGSFRKRELPLLQCPATFMLRHFALDTAIFEWLFSSYKISVIYEIWLVWHKAIKHIHNLCLPLTSLLPPCSQPCTHMHVPTYNSQY